MRIEQTWVPFTQRCIMPSLVEIGPVVLENVFKGNFNIFRNYLPLEIGLGTMFK